MNKPPRHRLPGAGLDLEQSGNGADSLPTGQPDKVSKCSTTGYHRAWVGDGHDHLRIKDVQPSRVVHLIHRTEAILMTGLELGQSESRSPRDEV